MSRSQITAINAAEAAKRGHRTIVYCGSKDARARMRSMVKLECKRIGAPLSRIKVAITSGLKGKTGWQDKLIEWIDEEPVS